MFCYIHKGDTKRNIDTNIIKKSKDFYAPVKKDKNGEYKIKSGQIVYVCFSSDFFVKDADFLRDECWEIIKKRSDLTFLFLTKRIERFYECIPKDWGEGYDNVIIGCTVENQETVDIRLPIFSRAFIKHKNIICQPLIEFINIEKYLNGIELVVVGGESDINARVLDYEWVLAIREQCIKNDVSFEFRQLGSNFIKNGKKYKINVKSLGSQAKKANINYKAKKQ